MGIKKPENIQSFEQLNEFAQDLYNNLSIADLKAGDMRTEAPTDKTLDKTRYTIAEVNGVPSIYYRARDGKLYKWSGIAA